MRFSGWPHHCSFLRLCALAASVCLQRSLLVSPKRERRKTTTDDDVDDQRQPTHQPATTDIPSDSCPVSVAVIVSVCSEEHTTKSQSRCLRNPVTDVSCLNTYTCLGCKRWTARVDAAMRLVPFCGIGLVCSRPLVG